jgi:ribosomal protein S18 acetylase RimI-like enzyme
MTILTTIRVADVDDAPAIAAVQVASWRTTYPGIVAQTYIDALSVAERTIAWERRMRGEAGVAPETVVAQTAAGAVVGFASGGPLRVPTPGFDAELYAIYLLREAQGEGLGRRLVAHWARLAVARGFQAAIVRVLTANPACRFYERLGARRVKEGSLELGGLPYPEAWYGWDDLQALVA